MNANPPPVLQATNLKVQRGNRTVLDIAEFSLYPGEVLAVIGPNGAGKSTLLLVLARLIPYTSGDLFFKGQPFERLDALKYRRQIGLVLQEPLLLDLSVYDNVASGLRFRHLPRELVEQRAAEWLSRLGVDHLRHRPARQLSGGEAQRTSLARAFALQPEILLLDEPFSSLDAPTRFHLLDDLQSLLAETATTTIFITHDLDEALYLGDRVAVILDGQLRQVGAPHQVFSEPTDQQVASFVGVETVIAGRVVAAQEGQVTVQANGLLLEAVGEVMPGRDVLLCLRPEDITLFPPGGSSASSARNRLAGNIRRIIPQGALARVVVDCCTNNQPGVGSSFPMTALITRSSLQEMGLAEGQAICAAFKATAVHLIPR